MKKILLILFLTSSISLFAQSFSTGTQTLLSGLTANINIDADTDTTTLTLTGPSNAWFAIGFGNLDMQGTDVFRTNGSTIVDAYSSGNALPAQDSSQDWTLVSNCVICKILLLVLTSLEMLCSSLSDCLSFSNCSKALVWRSNSSCV